MIEVFLLDALKKSIPNLFTRYPDKPPAIFTVFHRIDRGMEDHVSKCTIAFTSYGKNFYDAMKQDETVQEAVFKLTESPFVSRVELGGGSTGPDSANKLWSSEAIFNITYYEEVKNG